jgi:hypothetical protein
MMIQPFILVFILMSFFKEMDKLEEANLSYQQGEQASTLLERKEAFNRALFLYLEIEKNIGNSLHSPKLYEAIANSYFQLEEYAPSLLYHYKALEIEPINSSIQEKLNLAQLKLGLLPQIQTSPLTHLLSFGFRLSLPQRLELFFWMTLCTILGYSILIYFPSIWIKKMSGLLLIAVFFLFLNLLISFYFSPIEGVLIEPTGLYRDPHSQQSQLLSYPLLKGIKLTIVDVDQEGYWLKIKTSQGIIGYIPSHSVRII